MLIIAGRRFRQYAKSMELSYYNQPPQHMLPGAVPSPYASPIARLSQHVQGLPPPLPEELNDGPPPLPPRVLPHPVQPIQHAQPAQPVHAQPAEQQPPPGIPATLNVPPSQHAENDREPNYFHPIFLQGPPYLYLQIPQYYQTPQYAQPQEYPQLMPFPQVQQYPQIPQHEQYEVSQNPPQYAYPY